MGKYSQQDPTVIRESLDAVVEILNNQDFIEAYGQYIRIDKSVILPKNQDVVTEQMHKLENMKSEIKEQMARVEDMSGNLIKPEDRGIFFLVPLTGLVALPPHYQANRVLTNEDDTLVAYSITLINAIKHEGEDKDEEPIYSGASFAILGFRTQKKILKKNNHIDIYIKCVEYLNDFITAYKLLRHDHTVQNVTIWTLPSPVTTYIYSRGKVKKADSFYVHANLLTDLFSKRLTNETEMKDLKTFSEDLPMIQKDVQYALIIGERSIEDICLGRFEEAILNSDRFAELVLRHVLKEELDLSKKEMGKYRNLYSTSHPEKAVVQKLAERLGIKTNPLIKQWYRNSRDPRNKIVHSLDFESVTPDSAFDAVSFNMKLIDLVLSKSTKDFTWYRKLPETFSDLFRLKPDVKVSDFMKD